MKNIILLVTIIMGTAIHAQTLDFQYLGANAPPCNPFFDEPYNFFDHWTGSQWVKWKVSHGTPKCIDPNGQGFEDTAELTATHDGWNEKTEGLFIGYNFLQTHTYDIDIALLMGSGDVVDIEVWAANSMLENSNSNCDEDNLPIVSDKQLIVEIFSAGPVVSNVVGHNYKYSWQPNKNYDYFWIVARQPYSYLTGTTRIAYVDIVDKGIFQQPCQATLQLTTNVLNGQFDKQEASQSITATNTLFNGSSASYHAGQQVSFQPGFHAEEGAKLRAYIEGCSGVFQLRTENKTGPDAVVSEAITEIKNDLTVIMYPNPSSGRFTLEFPEIEGVTTSVYNLQGKEVYRKSDIKGNKLEVDISGQPDGIYFVRTILSEEIWVKKIIKE